MQVGDVADLTPAGSTSSERKPRAWILVAALVPFLVLAVWRAGDGPGSTADDYAQYLMHAQALAEGRPYSDIGYIYNGTSRVGGPPLQPPGLPLTLLPVFVVAGANMALIKFVLLVFTVAFLALAGRYFAVHDDWRLGVGVALLAGLSPTMVQTSTQVLSDLPFTAIVWALILVADRPGPWRAGRIAAITALGGTAILYRMAGLAVIPALLAFTVLRHREHRWKPVVPVAVWLGCLLIGLFIADLGDVSVLSLRDILNGAAFRTNGWGVGSILAYKVVFLESHLYPFPQDRLNDVFHLLTGALMAIGLAVWLRKAYRRFLVAFCVMYGLMLLALPLHSVRYLWPLFPVFVFGLLNGIRVVATLLFRAWPPARASRVALAYSLVIAPLAVLAVAATPHETGPLDAPDIHQVTTHLKESASGGQVRAVFPKPRALAWETGIPAMPLPKAFPPDSVVLVLRQHCITHVVLANASQHRRVKAVFESARVRPDAFGIALKNETFTVYELRAAGPDEVRTTIEACPAAWRGGKE